MLEKNFVFGYGDITKIYSNDEVSETLILNPKQIQEVVLAIEDQAKKFGLELDNVLDFFDWKSERFRLTMRRIRQDLRRLN